MPMFKQIGTYMKTPTGIEKWKVDLITYKIEVEAKDKVTIKPDADLHQDFSKYTLEVNVKDYDDLDVDIKSKFVNKGAKTTKTAIENEINKVTSHMSLLLTNDNLSAEDKDYLFELKEQKHELEDLLQTETITKIKIK